MSSDTNRTVPDLLGDLLQQTSSLVRKEVQLARAELNEKIGQVGTAATSIGIAAALLMAAVVILLQAVVALLVTFGLTTWLAGFIVGIVVAGIAYVLLRSGMNKMKAANLTPERTAHQVSRDATLAKEAVR
ncbi:phage holin family protein [Roseomonas marmotae]|uniref:Phage holin family protein n=1 Tax=Roseomonas marmotae TaxID=2768161 RepID=A0ABS3K767_9PROT|nr:phage holin family protein [Roseomonas marmotae]MBO1073319.1 phage holin family protein [Roseomonas marmotae]QTI79064.1 phage holin family protein [Roseomonas marmotae]